jgi:arylsulfatase A-like enzyme
MKLNLLLNAITFSGLFVFCACHDIQRDSNAPPNVIVILTDDQGWGDFSIHGNQNLATPNIDQLAKDGALFNHFYVAPVCSPTRAEFLTGRYHPRGGVYHTSEGGERLNLDETTIAEVFKNAGYATAAFGKWHNGMQYPYHPNGRGFDEFYGFCSGHWGDYFSPPLEHNGRIVQGEGFIPDDLTEKAMVFMEKNKNTPFFLYLPYNTPHSPMQVPDRWWDKFKDKELLMRGAYPEKENIEHTRAALAMCENVDWNVGKLMEKLRNLRLESNTIVLFFNDNGPNGNRWNNGMKGVKGSTDEGGIRSPLFIRWPGKIPAGKRISEIAGAIDLLSTLADMAGIEPITVKPLDGISLKPLLLEEKASWNDRVIFSHWNGRISARNHQYRFDHMGHLYDMFSDSGQTTDISLQKPEITQWFKKQVEEWKKDVLGNINGDNRKFPVGHLDFKYTQLPARDGKSHGGIVRSNRFPNSSYFTNWTSLSDSITWDIEVLADGDFAVEIYYTCSSNDVGAAIQLSFGNEKILTKITEAHDPPLIGMENDRVERMESYEKEFKPHKAGVIHLNKGIGTLTLKALEIPGSQALDFRLLMLTRIGQE